MIKRDKNGFPFEYLSEKDVLSNAKESLPVRAYDRPRSGGTLTQQIQILSLLTLFLTLLLILILLVARNVSLTRQKAVPAQTLMSVESLQVNID